MNAKLAEQYFKRADEFVQAGKPEEALPLLAVLDEAFPNQKNVLFARARTLAALGRGHEAIALCDQILAQFDAQRAEALKASLLAEEFAPEPSAGHTRGAIRPGLRMVTRAVVLLIGLALIGAAAVYAFRTANAPSVVAAPTKAEVQAREAARRQAKVHKANAPVTTSFIVHPPEQWALSAVNGVPDWKPGVYRHVPCLNAPERTIDVFVPMAYQAQPEALFPALIIQMPWPNPGFLKLIDWAESRDIILVVINSSHNDAFEQNPIAQDRALETVANTMRVDQRLGFAFGSSGGGRSSWHMISRYPDNFRGLVIAGVPRMRGVEIPTHVRIGYIHGDQEPNNWGKDGIYNTIQTLRPRGYDIREIVVPGGHVGGTPEQRIELLEWMLRETRGEFGLPHPDTPIPPAVRGGEYNPDAGLITDI